MNKTRKNLQIMQKKINSDIMKSLNKNRILRLIREFSYSRAEIAKATGLTRAAISFISEDMIEKGLIIEGEKENINAGRPATRLLINKNYGYFGGVYINRSGYVVGVCDFAGGVISERKGFVDANNADKTFKEIINNLKELIGDNNFLGIGVAAPGPLNKKAGRLLEISNFPSWRNFEVVQKLKENFNCPIVLDNVSNALARAEYYKNKSCGKKYLELIIDDGFGSSVAEVSNGIRLLECELGHTTVNFNGERCDCGNVGCAELYVNENKFNSTYVSDVETFYDALTSVILNAVNSFSINRVVFKGTVLSDFKLFRQILNTRLKKRLKKEIDIIKSSLDGNETFTACNLYIDTMMV